MEELTVRKEFEDMRLDRFISKAYSDLPKAAIQKLIRTGSIRVNGKKVPANARLCTGDIVGMKTKEQRQQLPEKKELPPPEIIYENSLLLAVNKPAGLITHPDGKKEDSLTDRIVMYLYDDIKQYNGMFIPGVVNRLDINTSGIVLAPKTPDAAKKMNALMRKNKFEKHYLTLVKGVFPERIKATHFAEKDRAHNKMILSDNPTEHSVEMISVFDPIETKNGYTLLSARLITGRTHQIRAQLSALGYPVVGDMKYGDAETNRVFAERYGLRRQFLHCYSVSFPTWTDGGNFRVLCKPPEDLRRTLDAFGFRAELF